MKGKCVKFVHVNDTRKRANLHKKPQSMDMLEYVVFFVCTKWNCVFIRKIILN